MMMLFVTVKFKGMAVCQRNTDRKSLSVERQSHVKADAWFKAQASQKTETQVEQLVTH